MKVERIFELVVWLFIVAGGLVAAYVSFGILSSDASGQLQRYSLSGAIVGAIVSWGVLTSVYLQIRGSSRELDTLREHAQVLEQKLIRGAPKPEKFTTEVDERQRIVLARPEEWQPKGGMIFDLETSPSNMEKEDLFAARFRSLFVPITNESYDSKSIFDDELKDLELFSNYITACSTEMVFVGGEQSGIESLKIIARQFARIERKHSHETGQLESIWNTVSREEFVGKLWWGDPSEVYVGKPIQVRLSGMDLRKGGACYVNGEKRETYQDENDMVFVSLMQHDVANPGTIELYWENEDAAPFRSNKVTIQVVQDYVADGFPQSTEKSLPTDLGLGDNFPIGQGNDEYESNDPPQLLGVKQENVADVSPQSLEKLPSHSKDPSSSQPKDQESGEDKLKIVYQEIVRMRVVCPNIPLKKIYIFEFFDDVRDFNDSSVVFNQVLNSVRFLN